MMRGQRSAPVGNIITDELRGELRRGKPVLAYKDENLEDVILTTAKNLDVLKSKLHFLCDGTFDSAPDGFNSTLFK